MSKTMKKQAELRLFANTWEAKIRVGRFMDAMNEDSLGSASRYAYQIVETAVRSVLEKYRYLNKDQRDSFDSMAIGAETCFEEVRYVIERQNPTFEITRTFVHPLFFALGIFGQISQESTVIRALPQIRATLLAHARRHVEKDPDVNPEALLLLACRLYESIRDRKAAKALACLHVFVDHLNSNLATESIGDLPRVEDPLIRLTEEEIATMLSSIRRGHTPLGFPPFEGGPRLQRLKRRIAAIERGDSAESHLLPILLEISSKLESRKQWADERGIYRPN